MDPFRDQQILQTRRQFLGDVGLRFGGLAMALLAGDAAASRARAADTLAFATNTPLGSGTAAGGAATAPPRVHPPLPNFPNHRPRAKALIYLHMNGGPSQIDTWDHKPGLADFFDKDLPPSIQGGQRLTGMTSGQTRFPVAPSKYQFERRGKAGRWVNTELLPYTANLVDDIALVKTVHTNAINHDPACTFAMSGNEIPGRPSIGSWLAYGLGSENNNLPAFVVFTPKFPDGSNGQAIYSRMWGSGFLPTRYGGVALRGSGDPVLYLPNPAGVSTADRRVMLDALNQLNARNHQRFGDPETQTRISQYEMAFRMQRSVPDLTDLSNEPKSVLDLYGPEVTKSGSFAHSALMARRLVERGVRVVQLLHRGWDQHSSLPKQIGNQCKDTDQATAALVIDLKQRGLLDDTLVVWGGEFGRTVYSQGKLTKDDYGRDHHPRNFCMWMAGGGVKAGTSYGETDDFSYNITENPVHLNDLNATILHLMGVDHLRFTHKFQGLDARLTGVEPARVVEALLA
jgi:hypothetical protein